MVIYFKMSLQEVYAFCDIESKKNSTANCDVVSKLQNYTHSGWKKGQKNKRLPHWLKVGLLLIVKAAIVIYTSEYSKCVIWSVYAIVDIALLFQFIQSANECKRPM